MLSSGVKKWQWKERKFMKDLRLKPYRILGTVVAIRIATLLQLKSILGRVAVNLKKKILQCCLYYWLLAL